MASTRRRHQPLSIEEALSRVSTAAETIKLRESVKPHESKRIREAFNLLEQLPVENGEKRGHYRHFLKKVNEKCGPQMVVICVVGLGQSTITNMKEYARLRLPLEIKKRHQALKDRVLDSIVETHRVKVPRNTSAHLESQSPLNLQASQYTDCVADAQPPQSTLTQQPPLKSGSQFTREQAYNKHLGHLEQSLSTIPSTGAGVQETIRQQPQGHKAHCMAGYSS